MQPDWKHIEQSFTESGYNVKPTYAQIHMLVILFERFLFFLK